MANSSVKKGQAHAHQLTCLYGKWFFALLALYICVRFGVQWQTTTLDSLLPLVWFFAVSVVMIKKIADVAKTGLNLSFSHWQDVLFINWFVLITSLFSPWFALVYLVIPLYILHKYRATLRQLFGFCPCFRC